MADYGSIYVLCPFYHRETEREMICEGMCDDCLIHLVFFSGRKKGIQKKVFCEKNYKKCEIYRMLEEKYKT